MKNKIIKMLFLCVTLCAVVFTFTACQEQHVHTYDKQVATEEYFASAAACEQKATYYLSCECGEKGAETFEYGNALEHSYTNYVDNKDAECEKDGTKTALCDNGCGKKDTQTDVGSALEHSFTNYLSDNNATYEKDGTKTALCDNGCGKTDTVNEDNTKLDSKITFKTLSVDGKTVSATLSNATEDFSFAEEIEITGIVNFEVSGDIYGSQIFLTKTVPLEIGDNTFYVFELEDGEITDTYTVNIRRRPNYVVTFNTNGGTAVERQTIEEGFLATKPADIEKAGYTFDGWDFDFSTAITENQTVNAKWIANTNTPYKVEYYLQNLNDNNYTLEETVNLTGTTDTTANAEIKTYDHFTAEQTSVSGNINGDESTVLKVYYTRNYYQITVWKENDNGTVTGGGSFANAQDVTVKATVNAGYDFDGWYDGNEKVSSDLEYTFNPVKNITLTAKLTIKNEMLPFNFTSTATTCTITSVKDKNVTTVSIPNYVTSFAYDAFTWCSSLRSVTIGNSVTSIGFEAFRNCTSLQSVTIGNSVTSIGNWAFEDCTSLQSVTIPNSVTTIGYSAFAGCTSLQSITIPDGVTSIGDGAFSGCSSLNYNEKDGLKYLGNEENKYLCLISPVSSNIATANIDNNCKVIGDGAFRNCTSLQSVTIGNSVTFIGDGAFSGCSSLTKVNYTGTIDQWVQIDFIGFYSNPLYYAKNLYINDKLVTDVVLTTATEIKAYAFYECTSLQSITIPDSVTSISRWAFDGCDNLSKVNYTGTIDQWVQIDFAYTSSNPLYYAKNLYINDKLVTDVVLTTATEIKAYAFYECTSLQSITIPDSVTSISRWAFSYCTNLQSVTIPDSVTSIGDYAFYYCTNLQSITIPDSVTSIGPYAFYGCTSLQSVTIGNSVTYIGNDAFYGCTSLTKVNYTGTIDQWVQIDFAYTSSNPLYYAKNLYINDKLVTDVVLTTATEIKAYAFYECTSLQSITIPDSVTSIGDRAFYGCDKLTIYCEAQNQPSDWNSNWNYSNRPVVWGYKQNNLTLTLKLESTVRNKTVLCDYSTQTEYLQSLGFNKVDDTTYVWNNVPKDTLIPTLPNPKPLDNEEYAFSAWKYVDGNKKVTVKAGTVINAENFPVLENSNELVLVAQCYALWTPFY